MESRRFHADDLVVIAPAPPSDAPPLTVGEECRLNSGGPVMLVVGSYPESVVVAWGRDGEATFPRACVRRVATLH